MKIKICGLFRDEDIDYANEARPDYIGFVFAKSPRQVSTVMAQYLRFRLADSIEPVGVFANVPVKLITELYKSGTVSIAQLHGNEDEGYIRRLKEITGKENLKAIKIIKSLKLDKEDAGREIMTNADFLLLDSGAGTGKQFDWSILRSIRINKPWFLAGGINIKNIDKALAMKPFAIDVSSGVETNGLKDRNKILQLTSRVKPRGSIEINYTMTVEHRRKSLSISIKGL